MGHHKRIERLVCAAEFCMDVLSGLQGHGMAAGSWFAAFLGAIPSWLQGWRVLMLSFLGTSRTDCKVAED